MMAFDRSRDPSELIELVESADEVAAELMRRGLNPAEVRMRDVLAYFDNMEQVRRADALATLSGLTGGESDGF